MSLRRLARVGVSLGLALALPGCLTRSMPVRTSYVLDVSHGNPAPVQPSSNLAPGRLFVDAVRVNPLFERKGFVYRMSDTIYERDFYHELLAPPGKIVRETLVRWLRESPTLGPRLEQHRASAARWWIRVRIDELYADLRDPRSPRSVIAVSFELIDASTPELAVAAREHYRQAQPASDSSPQALVQAWNAALEHVLEQLEVDLIAALGS